MNKIIKVIICLLGFTAVIHSAEAQILKKIQKKIEDSAEKKVDDLLNGKEKSTPSSTTKSNTGMADLFNSEPFVAGNQIIFEDHLIGETVGKMPRYWQTNSTGSVSTVSGQTGKWLRLAPEASYQLDTLLQLPENFTLEFDLLTRSEKASDIRDIVFGFSKNNSTRSYIYGVSNDGSNVATSFMFYYEAISTRSNNTKNNSRLEYPLNNFANAVIHVSISVQGEKMQVYFNKDKVLDAVVLHADAPKHFFISTDRWRNNTSVYLSNMRIAAL